MQVIEKPRAPSKSDLLSQIRSIIIEDLKATDQLICNELLSKVPLIQEITKHIVDSGGKRLRPLLLLLSASACGYNNKDTEHHELAAIIEFVHTATLLHDDVIDESQLRRGRDTANALWGNQASVLVGDFLYSRAFQILARRSNIPVMKCFADTTNAIAEGEVWQLMNQHNPDITTDEYYQVIYHKTAKLFESAAEIGAMIAGQNEAIQKAMAAYGLEIGLAFQIIDDLLDYCSNPNDMGKNVGDDLAEGKVTLPLIFAMQNGNADQQKMIRNAIQEGGLDDFSKIQKALEASNAIALTQQAAETHAQKARECLTQLPISDARDAMEKLTTFALQRSY